MNDMNNIENILKEYGPAAVEKLESVAILTASVNIFQGIVGFFVILTLFLLMYKLKDYIYKNTAQIYIVVLFHFSAIVFLLSSIYVCLGLLDPWNYIALVDPKSWAIHELLLAALN